MTRKLTARVPCAGLARGTRKITVEAEGYQGTACSVDIKNLLDSCGLTIAEETNKPEIYEELAPPEVENYSE